MKSCNSPEAPDVIIPTFRPDTEKLSELLEKLYAQTRRPGRILLVNTNRDYWDTELEKSFPEISVIHVSEEEFDHGGSRNLGYRAGDGEIVVFMTQDAIPADENLIENLCRHFDNEMAAVTGAVYARQSANEEDGWLEAETRKFNYPETMKISSAENVDSLGIKGYFCSNTCAAYRRAALDEAGGFCDPCIFGEDMLAAADLIHNGYQIIYEPEAVVFHSHHNDLAQHFRRNFDIGVMHQRNCWLFGRISGTHEGVRLVASLAKKAVRSSHAGYLPELFIVSAVKFAGYQLGKRYDRLPRSLIHRFSANKYFWKKTLSF